MAKRKKNKRSVQVPRGTPPPELEEEESARPDLKVVSFERKRPPALRLSDAKKQEITSRVLAFAKQDMQNREHEMEERLQLHAKLHQVTSGERCRWGGSSDVALTDIAAGCFREEDTNINAALSVTPICEAVAANPEQHERERRISRLLHHQMMVEQPGERLIEQLAADFTRDGVYTILTTWVREKRFITQVREFDGLPADKKPEDYFRSILQGNMGMLDLRKIEGSEWDWRVKDPDGDYLNVHFYTNRRGKVEAEVSGDKLRFNAPKFIRYAYENVLFPFDCDNLQAPSPSNPGGASHAILIDRPTVGEVKKLIREGEYNRVSLTDISEHPVQDNRRGQSLYELSIEDEVDAMNGFEKYVARAYPAAANHGVLTRYTCYDVWERADGEEIDVVFTVLPELKLLVRAVPLGEDCPIIPPMRPLSESARIPITGRRLGFSLPKTMEGTHDVKKDWVDLMLDGSELEATPMFTYKERGALDDTDYSIYPGHGLPVRENDDVSLLQFRPQSGAVAVNVIGLMDGMQEDVSMLGELQAGRVPAGKSSALRNKGTVEQLLLQGEARPQRLLARFFSGIRHAWFIAYGLNVHYLDKKKVFRVIGAPRKGEQIVKLQEGDLSADIEFSFAASIFNASKIAQQNGLESYFQILANPLMIEIGIATAEGLYRLQQDMGRALGVDPDRYSSPPSEQGSLDPISAQGAFNLIIAGQVPEGRPQEAPEQHVPELQRLLSEYTQGQVITEALTAEQQLSLVGWFQAVQRFVQEQQAKQRQVQAAQQAAAQQQQGAQPGAVGGAPAGAGPVERNDVVNETLPGSGTPQ